MIDWTDVNCAVTPHFNVKDACYLHAWGRLATAEDGMDPDKLMILCNKMEQIRNLLGGIPINVHCMFRSPGYNVQIGASPNDVHSMNLACDFDCNGHLTIAQLQSILEPQLENLGIRMERNTPTWVHIDLHPVMNARYFNA